MSVNRLLTYSMNVTNGGPAVATDVEVGVALSASVTFVGGSTPQGSCSGPAAGTPGTARCRLGTIANAATLALSIEVRPTTTGLLALTASERSAGRRQHPIHTPGTVVIRP